MTSSPFKQRSDALKPPAPTLIAQALGLQAINIEWLAGDGSDRCYYRIDSPELDKPLVLMQLSGSDALALQAGGYDWIKIADVLSEHGISVPRVSATLPAHAALLIEDYGNQMLEGLVLDHLTHGDWPAVGRIYSHCTQLITRFLAIAPSSDAVWCKRSFDAERFTWELTFFMDKYALPVAGVKLSGGEKEEFKKEVALLSQTLAANSKYFVHRDFHSRNLMAKGDHLAVIDFQDARLGPACYDLVSLCFDSYIPFDAVTRRQLLEVGIGQIKAANGDAVHQEVVDLWRPMLLQRQLKAIGSFGYLTLDKQRGDYLKYVPQALASLEGQQIEDDRWPLLSGTILQRMRQHLEQIRHAPRP